MQNMTVFSEIVRRYKISMELKRVRKNPIVSGSAVPDGIAHYRCRLSRPGRAIDVYLSGDSSADHLMTTSDVLFVLAMDASGCKMLEGYSSIKDEWSASFSRSDGDLKDIQAFWEEYAGRCMQTERLRGFLGEDGYEELLHNFGMEEVLAAAV